MKRSESLSPQSRYALIQWARLVRNPAIPRGRFTDAMNEAQQHGLNAVRAVREIGYGIRSYWPLSSAEPMSPTCYAVSEARAAFRSALRAVGLKTL